MINNIGIGNIEIGFGPGVDFRISESIVTKLRDAAIESAIEAEVRRLKWEHAVTEFAEDRVSVKFGHAWRGTEGEIEFSDGIVEVKLVEVCRPSWADKEPTMVFHRKLKSGKYSKVNEELAVSDALRCFRPA